MAIGGLPIWEAGHEFLSWEPRLRTATAHSPLVVTFGLVIPQLALLSTSEGVRRVAERWGLENLANLASRYRQARGVPGTPVIAELAASLTQQVYFPELDPATGEPLPVEMPPEHQIALLFEEFAHGDGKGIVEWIGFRSFAGTAPLAPSQQVGGGMLGGYLGLLREAAAAQTRFQPPGLGDLVRRVYETLDAPRGLRAVYDPSSGEERHVPTYRNLAERAAIELERTFMRSGPVSVNAACATVCSSSAASVPRLIAGSTSGSRRRLGASSNAAFPRPRMSASAPASGSTSGTAAPSRSTAATVVIPKFETLSPPTATSSRRSPCHRADGVQHRARASSQSSTSSRLVLPRYAERLRNARQRERPNLTRILTTVSVIAITPHQHWASGRVILCLAGRSISETPP